jgi:iron complex transport system substrate-binding protein
MKRLLYVLLALTLLLSACTPVTPAPAATLLPTTVPQTSLKDGLGRTVTLAKPATKIVSLAPSNTEILFALNAGSQVIGRDELSDYPEEAKKLASVGGSMGKYNFEQIAKLQPDLVLASSLNTPEQIKTLEDLKLNVFVLANPTTLEGMYQNLTTVGQLTGHQTDAQVLVTKFQERQKKVTDTLANLKDRPKVFYELDASEPAKPFTAGANTFIDLLIRAAGGTNIAASLKGDYPQISQEDLLSQNPDIILLGDAAYGMTPEQVVKRPGWTSIKAVKENKVLAIDDNLISRPGPRLIDGLESMAKLIHPEMFK